MEDKHKGSSFNKFLRDEKIFNEPEDSYTTSRELIRRKAGELFVLMYRLKEFRTEEFFAGLGPEKTKMWKDLIQASKTWIEDEDERHR